MVRTLPPWWYVEQGRSFLEDNCSGHVRVVTIGILVSSHVPAEGIHERCTAGDGPGIEHTRVVASHFDGVDYLVIILPGDPGTGRITRTPGENVLFAMWMTVTEVEGVMLIETVWVAVGTSDVSSGW